MKNQVLDGINSKAVTIREYNEKSKKMQERNVVWPKKTFYSLLFKKGNDYSLWHEKYREHISSLEGNQWYKN